MELEVETLRGGDRSIVRQIATLTVQRSGSFSDPAHPRKDCDGHFVSTVRLTIVGHHCSGHETWSCTVDPTHDQRHPIPLTTLAEALRRYKPELTRPEDDADRILEEIARARG